MEQETALLLPEPLWLVGFWVFVVSLKKNFNFSHVFRRGQEGGDFYFYFFRCCPTIVPFLSLFLGLFIFP